MDETKSQTAQGRDRERCFQEENDMSSPITPPQGPLAPTASRPSARPQSVPPSASAGSIQATGAPVSLDTFPSSPPRQVLDEISAAGAAYQRLRAQGRELVFSPDEQTGALTIKLRDQSGNDLRTVSPSEAIDIAAGQPAD
jgi:hypothetical protein